MRQFVVAIALTAMAGIAAVQAQTYPSRSVTLIVAVPAGRLDRHRRAHHGGADAAAARPAA